MLQTMRNSMRHFAPKKYLPHLALLLITSVLIFYRLNVPQALIFDETYHIPSAQKYLNGVFYQENHPPIGKLLIAFGQLLYGSFPAEEEEGGGGGGGGGEEEDEGGSLCSKGVLTRFRRRSRVAGPGGLG